ncbi:threonine aldolase family protein [Ligilactobacillus ceti]|uniref:Aromatic amino acid beta-eliminating lyase/threonine aldolase domain-containing protein n=1 Tax=Ligilactobacillus ceti DSM 22408 TaxID=1122146 RepID=A0A0R2KLS9_9LACO|nr:aminotransferase class I/II-fold pyridoxal phosphate-dependent enzyme [Ligilactobacillus ceti]KRN90379.1 hypothetical protein IV53_GL000294 [Ligilactobacillus ceti DSM 22408]
MRICDFSSDLKTQPTSKMQKALKEAQNNPDQQVVTQLEKRAAEILHKEAALFVSSGTLATQLALVAQSQPGDEILISDDSYLAFSQAGVDTILADISYQEMYFVTGVPDVVQIENYLKKHPKIKVISLENALFNGEVMDVVSGEQIYQLAQRYQVKVHIDGARLFNAALALGVDIGTLTKDADTVACCLAKGLCAPSGALLAGSREVIQRAKQIQRKYQASDYPAAVYAAAGLIALEEMPQELKKDHANAQYLAAELANLKNVVCDIQQVKINLVFGEFLITDRKISELEHELALNGFKVGSLEDGKFRFVTNHDINREDVKKLVAIIQRVVDE